MTRSQRRNTLVIESPGLNRDTPHTVRDGFTDIELCGLLGYLRAIPIHEPVNDETALAVRRLVKLLAKWQETSP